MPNLMSDESSRQNKKMKKLTSFDLVTSNLTLRQLRSSLPRDIAQSVDNRSDVNDLRTRDSLYNESRPVRYEGCCSLTALYRGLQSCSRLGHAPVTNGDP